MNESLQFHAEQVSTNQELTALFYIFATMGVFLGVIAITLIDAGLASRKNLVDTVVQKVLCVFISALSFMLMGYAIWNYQYYQAFSVPHPFLSALKDWWFAGGNMEYFAQFISPDSTPEADTFQIFSIFFFCFAGLTAALIHGSALERINPKANYIMSAFIGAIMVPVLSYLTYGSTSPLTNSGLHDFVGAYCLYMFVGGWSLILAWRIGPRVAIPATPTEPGLVIIGQLLLMLAIPMFVIGCGFLTPGSGYFGPTMSTSGLGIVFVNTFIAMGGGALTGGIIAYAKKKPFYILSGPIAGYLACSALYDVVTPQMAFLLSLPGPFILILGEKVLSVLGIDDPKVVPLALGPSIYSVLVVGLVASGTPQGGYAGITQGPYRFQHAHISFATQLEGVVVVLLITFLTGLVVTSIINKIVGLRVSAEAERVGGDEYYWSLSSRQSDTSTQLETTPVN